MRIHRLALLGILPTALAIDACSDDDTVAVTASPDAGPTADPGAPAVVDAGGIVDAGPVDFALRFEAQVGGQAFHCGSTYAGLGTTPVTVEPEDLRFFVADVKLLRTGTGEAVPVALATNAMQSRDVALLDFEDKTGQCGSGTTETNDTVLGVAPAGTYDGIQFSIGVPETLNHINTAGDASAPLLGSTMQWGWTAGFKHMSMGLIPTLGDGGKPGAFYTHVGSTGCADGTACTTSNRPTVKLAGFDPATSKIVFDLQKLYTGSDLSSNTALTAPGCMSGATDPECPPIFERLGLDDAGASFASPVVFAVAPK